MIITLETSKIQCQHVCDRRTDGQTDGRRDRS